MSRDDKRARSAGLYFAAYVSAHRGRWDRLTQDTHPCAGGGIIKAALDAHDSAQWLATSVGPDFAEWSIPGVFASPAAYATALDEVMASLAHRRALLAGHVAASPGMMPMDVKAVLDELDGCVAAVTHARDKLAPAAAAPPQATALDKALLVADRFPAIVASLARRPQGREPLVLADEYDVQYLFEAVLALLFDDIRPEESGGSFGGGSVRIDTLLAADGVAVEYKMTRPRLNAVALRKQLADDVMAHKENPKIRQLLFFVYDPAKRIDNPRGFEADLSKPVGGLETVRTIIQQG